jgi:ABC-type sugar transport system ATPase subunit
MAAIRLEGIDKAFASGQPVLRGIDLDVADGERLALVGPSGSGKSTVLRIIAGLEAPTRGRVLIDGQDVTDVAAERRDLAMVFQSYALYPHKNVRENLAFGLRVRGIAADEIRARVDATAASLGLSDLLERRPSQLSGGQRQRVAVGRAIVRDARAFLFDEPLSNLDPRLRGDTRAELIELHGRLRATMVYVTHDQEEAMTLGQRVAVLNQGRVEQIDAPERLYTAPATTFVAQFIGSPPMNLIEPGRLKATSDITLAPDAALIGIRPHDIRLMSQPALLGGRVQLVEFLGASQIVHVQTDGGRITAVTGPERRFGPGDGVQIGAAPAHLHFFDSKGGRIQGVVVR